MTDLPKLPAGAVLAKAIEVAMDAHAGQFRRDGVTPYITHPAAVAASLADESEEVQAVAWLHDVVEDTTITVPYLRMIGFPESVASAVALLTKQKGDSYESYLDWINSNPIARKVKIADIRHNLSDSPTPKQVKKYTLALARLNASPDEHDLPLAVNLRCTNCGKHTDVTGQENPKCAECGRVYGPSPSPPMNTSWNAAVEACIQMLPGGQSCDPQKIADDLRELIGKPVADSGPEALIETLVRALEAEKEARHYESELVNQADNPFIAGAAETKRRIADDLRIAALSAAEGWKNKRKETKP